MLASGFDTSAHLQVARSYLKHLSTSRRWPSVHVHMGNTSCAWGTSREMVKVCPSLPIMGDHLPLVHFYTDKDLDTRTPPQHVEDPPRPEISKCEVVTYHILHNPAGPGGGRASCGRVGSTFPILFRVLLLFFVLGPLWVLI